MIGLRNLFAAMTRAAAPPAGDGKLRARDGRDLDLELYKKYNCPYCQRVYQTLSRLCLRDRMLDILRDPDALATLVRIGGKRQVPCLFIDGNPLYESADIVHFLDTTFAEPSTSG